jgi:deoxyribonuclease IV
MRTDFSRQASRRDELGAHVSTAGGVVRAPERAALIDSAVLQLFTKQPSRWAEPVLDEATAVAFRAACRTHGVTLRASHDSYLINLATADPVLHARSLASFSAELERCTALGIELLVTHPGNATDGDVESGIARNAAAIEQALAACASPPLVLLETTAGTGRSLGHSFEQLAAIIERIGNDARAHVGVCLDTCHVWAAGYDLVDGYDGVITHFDDVLGLDRLRLFHLNDSVGGRGSRRDRHAGIGEGTLGDAPFHAIMNDSRVSAVPKVLETPKGDDHTAADLRNLGRLRGFRGTPAPTEKNV